MGKPQINSVCGGSIGLFIGSVRSEDWVIISTAYIAIEGVTNIVERLRKS